MWWKVQLHFSPVDVNGCTVPRANIDGDISTNFSIIGLNHKYLDSTRLISRYFWITRLTWVTRRSLISTYFFFLTTYTWYIRQTESAVVDVDSQGWPVALLQLSTSTGCILQPVDLDSRRLTSKIPSLFIMPLYLLPF